MSVDSILLCLLLHWFSWTVFPERQWFLVYIGLHPFRFCSDCILQARLYSVKPRYCALPIISYFERSLPSYTEAFHSPLLDPVWFCLILLESVWLFLSLFGSYWFYLILLYSFRFCSVFFIRLAYVLMLGCLELGFGVANLSEMKMLMLINVRKPWAGWWINYIWPLIYIYSWYTSPLQTQSRI